jgi:hypothetical protein
MLVVWRFYDGKPGHDRQSAGLLQALAATSAIDAVSFDVRERPISVWHYLSRRLPVGAGMPAPDLVIGAGRRCQWPVLAARRARGGRTIYLMKPQLPVRCFDLCLIPRHDRPRANPRIIVTDGVLNDMQVPTRRPDRTLLLIGGPSDHFAWDESALVAQIQALVDAAPEKTWVIADSRRTPPATSAALQQLAGDHVTVVPFREAERGWLVTELARSDIAWVSADSVSMIYEALTVGAAVGVLEVPAKREDRISGIAADLAARGLVTPYRNWRDGAVLTARPPLAEAARCADLVLQRWAPATRTSET